MKSLLHYGMSEPSNNTAESLKHVSEASHNTLFKPELKKIQAAGFSHNAIYQLFTRVAFFANSQTPGSHLVWTSPTFNQPYLQHS